MRVPTFLALSCLMASSVSHADEITFSGNIALESRTFFERPARSDQLSGTQVSFTAAPEWQWENGDRRWSVRASPFVRLDNRDDHRSHVDIREASIEYYGDEWDAMIGIGAVFWGVTESRHLVNIINQIDTLEDIDEESFLGQPMIRAGTQQDWGRIDVFLMSGFRERAMASDVSRLRPLVPVSDEALFESDAEQSSVDLAARYSNVFGNWDVAVSGFHGTSREPTLIRPPGAAELSPHYAQITQLGVEAQFTTGPWLWKLESIAREGHGDTFAAAVAGFEYTLYQPWATKADIGIIAEYLFDDRSGAAPVTPFENDLFLGTRFAWNDAQDTSLLVGGIVDLENGLTSLRLEAQRRIGSSTLIEIEAQFFEIVDDFDPLFALKQDSHLTIRLARYF